jgi:hypothetical protein
MNGKPDVNGALSIERDTNAAAWTIKTWCPGLENDHETLKRVLDTLPGDRQDQIPFMVRLFENPKSPIAFQGAIDLFRHDCVHILLGRGTLPQDEAFVVGFTMGATKRMSKLKLWLFQTIGKYLYTPPYNFTKDEAIAYRHGVDTGERAQIKDIHLVPFELLTHLTLGTIRGIVRLDKAMLYAAFAVERELLPHGVASQRLPTSEALGALPATPARRLTTTEGNA